MFKELTISIVIVIAIVVLNNVTQAYTDKSVSETTKELEELRNDIIKTEKEHNDIVSELNDIYDKWMEYHEKLSYYIEHNELEKAETQLTALKGYVEMGEYNVAVSELDKTIFILKRIEDKYDFALDNVF